MEQQAKDIARLAAEGCARVEIAKRLSITETQVTRVATEHGIRTRNMVDLATPAETLTRMAVQASSHLADDIDVQAAVIGLEPEYVADLMHELRTGEAELRKLRQRLDALQGGEPARACPVCGKSVTGRSDAVYCSTACRVNAHRARNH
ncbi:hypothetical protein [Aestuariimicrobium sp. Y1814]|uniref:hypothetical protein n=1 Tax=Aestuariimicrobium sp. Y1814 TaxID=3418742 RepID=UPI003DA706A7